MFGKKKNDEKYKNKINELTTEIALLKSENEVLKNKINSSPNKEYDDYMQKSMNEMNKHLEDIRKLHSAYETLFEKNKKYISKEQKEIDKAIKKEIKDFKNH